KPGLQRNACLTNDLIRSPSIFFSACARGPARVGILDGCGYGFSVDQRSSCGESAQVSPAGQKARQTSSFCGLFSPFPQHSFALAQARYVEAVPRRGSFAIAQGRTLASIYVDPNDNGGVARAARDLQADVARVTGRSPRVADAETHLGTNAIVIGTIGKNAAIDWLIRQRRIDVTGIAGQWE